MMMRRGGGAFRAAEREGVESSACRAGEPCPASGDHWRRGELARSPALARPDTDHWLPPPPPPLVDRPARLRYRPGRLDAAGLMHI